MSEFTVQVKPTPRQLAEMFCAMGSTDMAEFLIACNEISEAWLSPMGIFYQALHVRDHLDEMNAAGLPGKEFVMNFAAPWFHHTLAYCERTSA